jgi:hypothetical protein
MLYHLPQVRREGHGTAEVLYRGRCPVCIPRGTLDEKTVEQCGGPSWVPEYTARPQSCLCWDPLGTYENGQEGEDRMDGSDVRATGGESAQEVFRQQGLTCHRVGRYELAGHGMVTVCDVAMPVRVASEAVGVRSITPAQQQRDATAPIFGNLSDDSMLLLQPCVTVQIVMCPPPPRCGPGIGSTVIDSS